MRLGRPRHVGAAVAIGTAWLGWRGLRTPPPPPTPPPQSATAPDEDDEPTRVVRRAAPRPAAPAAEAAGGLVPLDAVARDTLAGPALEARLRELDSMRGGLVRRGEPPPEWFEGEFRTLETRYFLAGKDP